MAVLRKAKDRGETDLEAWEEAIRTAVLRHGADLLESLLTDAGCGRPKQPLRTPNGQPMHSIGVRIKTITTLLGEVTLRRSVFADAEGLFTRTPLDESLGVGGTSFSPGVRRFMARAGSRTSFAEASEDLAVYAHLDVTAKQVQRVAEDVGRSVEDWNSRQVAANSPGAAPSLSSPSPLPVPVPILYVSFDGTGIPMRKAELLASKGKGADGKAKTREVKLGCVFTQTSTDEEGRPVRDPDSTTYVGAIESSELFGLRIYQEAVRRGCEQAEKIVILTDGARYNKTIASTHFPAATHIIDLYHAREHLTDLAKALDCQKAQLAAWNGLLDMGRIEDLVVEARSRIDQLSLPPGACDAEDCRKRLGYFQGNAEHMRYAQYRLAGFFVGSGVVEAGCRTVIGQRLKHSGMFWSLRGANAIIASRCCQLSGRFDDFWEDAV
jgi:hypothetical protein